MDGNVPSDQESVTSGGSGATKKSSGSPFDSLSREDLVKKCRGLLGIAQKAKQAKDECLEENRKLKEQLSQAETQKAADKDCLKAMQEMVSSLTEQKLSAAMKVDELEKVVAGLRREVDGAALLRDQLDKLSVQNEAFQRQIKRLTDENEELLADLSSMEEKMKALGDEKDKVDARKVVLEQELLKTKNEAALSGKEEKLIRKLKLYKNKVQEISAKVLLLKSDRKILLKTVKDYSEQVPKWQQELLKASDVLFIRIKTLERENASLKKANVENANQKDVESLEQLQQVVAEKEALETSNADKQKVIEDMDVKNSNLNTVVEQIEEKLRLEQAEHQKLQAENQELAGELDRLRAESTQDLSQLRNQLEDIQQRFAEQTEQLEIKNSQLTEYERKLLQDEEDNEKVSRLQTSHEEKDKQLQQLQEELQESVSKLIDLQSRYDVLQASNDETLTTKAELQVAHESLEARNRELIDQLQEVEITSRQLSEPIEQLKSDSAQVVSDLQKQLDEFSGKQSSETKEQVKKAIADDKDREEMQNSLADAEQALLNKEKELQRVQALGENLKAENENLLKRILEGEESTRLLAEEFELLQVSVSEAYDQVSSKDAQFSQFEQKLRQEAEQNEKARNTIAELHNSMAEKDSAFQQLQQKLQESISFLETTQSHHDLLAAQNLQLEERMQEAQSTSKQLSETIEQLKVDSAQVESEHQKRLDELQQHSAKQSAEFEEQVKKEFADDKNREKMQKSLAEAEKAFLNKEEELQLIKAQGESLRAENEHLQKRVLEQQETTKLLADKVELIQKSLSDANDLLDSKDAELSQFEQKLRQEAEQNEKGRNAIIEKEAKLQESISALEALQGRHDLLAAQSQQLQTANNILSDENTALKSDLQTVQSKLELVKLENSDLLSELKEINEILKERGGVISLQLSKISELESQKAALQQKLAEYTSPDLEELKQRAQDLERQLAEKEAELRERDRSFDAQSDVMSTSTISRAEESARMRDVDDSFEEKYNKLRSLAVKLKKKVAEQTLQLQKFEKERETLSGGKNLQSLQAEYDRLLDQLEAERQGAQQKEAELSELKDKLEKQQQEIETLNQVRTELDSSSKKDKCSLETTIREYREQLQNLKREKEAFNLAKKEIDAENQKLKATLKAKEKQLSDELEAQKELKAEVEKCRLAAKKANVLNLEMEAYEKSLAELNKKLETKKVHEKELEGTIEVQEGTIKSLKSQMTLLEQSLNAERSHSQELKKNVDLQQEKLRVSEHQRGEVNVELAQLKVEYERIKLEMESNRVELSEAVTEKEKASSLMESEKSKLLKQIYTLECDAEEIKTKLKEKSQEVEDVRTEFASYKIRAQSVLRQNQNKEGGKERELQEEVQTLQKSLELSQLKLQTFTQQISELGKSCEELREDKTRLQNRCKELHDLLEESRLQNESLMEESRRANLNHQEALKTQRLQNETLISCYKKQIEELQEQHSKEVESLQSRITQISTHHPSEVQVDSRNNNHSIPSTSSGFGFFRGQHISDEQKINLLLMEREEGEGSESTSSHPQIPPSAPRRKSSNSSQPPHQQRSRSNRDLIPLDELLNSSFDDGSTVFEADSVADHSSSVSPTAELHHTKDKLTKQESRVRHLTALLAEAEQDLAKLTQLNELLKEEVRRHERAIEREKHVHNSEYLKNVIFKFLTLNSGDEKSHLVPVLNTILRLSPEETQKLNNVARGTDGSGRGWTGILWN